MLRKLLFLCFITFIITGCSSDSSLPDSQSVSSETNDVETDDIEVIEETEIIEDTETEGEVNEFSDDRVLTVPGEKFKEDNGEIIELVKISQLNQTLDLGSIQLKIHDIKLFKRSNTPPADLEYMQIFVENVMNDPFYYAQIGYTAKNTVTDEVNWLGISHIVLDSGEQVRAETNDFMQSKDYESSFYGEVIKDEFIGVVFNTAPSSI